MTSGKQAPLALMGEWKAGNEREKRECLSVAGRTGGRWGAVAAGKHPIRCRAAQRYGNMGYGMSLVSMRWGGKSDLGDGGALK